jgi:hypothetical protein
MTKTIKEVLQKLQWLKNIIVECQSMDKYHKMDNKALFPAWSEVEDLITDIEEEKYDSLKKIIRNSTPEKLKKKEEKINTIVGKLMMVKEMIEVVDGARIATGYSAYGFIMDIKDQAEKRMGLSRKQMEAVNKVYKKYKVKYDKKIDLEKK